MPAEPSKEAMAAEILTCTRGTRYEPKDINTLCDVCHLTIYFTTPVPFHRWRLCPACFLRVEPEALGAPIHDETERPS